MRSNDWAFESKLADNLKAKREELFWKTAFSGGWTSRQGELHPYGRTAVSRRIGIGTTALHTWENGISVPSSQEKWEAWAEALGAKIDFRLEFRG